MDHDRIARVVCAGTLVLLVAACASDAGTYATSEWTAGTAANSNRTIATTMPGVVPVLGAPGTTPAAPGSTAGSARGTAASAERFVPTASSGGPSPEGEITIIGRAVCRQTAYASSAGPGQWRGSAITCDVSSSDARVAGTQTIGVSVNVRSDASAFVWGPSSLENAAGTWEGRYAAFVEAPYPDGTHHVGAVLTGSSGYVGLRLSETWTTSGDGYDVLAWIEPVD